MRLTQKIKPIIVANLYRNYHLAKWYNLLRLQRTHTDSEVGIIIFQMGKVGSTTIWESLKQTSVGLPIFHVHVLTPEKIKTVENRNRDRWNQFRNPQQLWHSLFLSKKLKKTQNLQQKWKVITLVREPIIRNISSFFQTRKLLSAEDQQKLTNSNDTEELVNLFLTQYYDHEAPLTWFDMQLKPVFGIDVFEKEFPTDAGYCIYPGDIADVLLIRLEDLNRCHTQAFKEFLDIDNFQLKNANIAKDKDYSQAYTKLRRSKTLPATYIDRMYQSKYARHFYTDEELDRFTYQYSRNPSNSPKIISVI